MKEKHGKQWREYICVDILVLPAFGQGSFIFLVSPFNNYSGIVALYLMTMQKLVLQPVYIV